jgi:hypothetical protein
MIAMGVQGTQRNTRTYLVLGSDPVGTTVATFLSMTSGRPSALRFADGYTYNVAMGGDAAGSFLVWAAKYETNAGTPLWSISQASNMQVNGNAVFTGNLSVSGTMSVTGSNVAFKNIDNAFVAQTFPAGCWITGANSLSLFYDTSGPVDKKLWRLLQYSDGLFRFEQLDDAYTRVIANAMNLLPGGTIGLGPVSATNYYSSGGGNSFGDLTVRGATNFQNGVTASGGDVNGAAHFQNTGQVYPGRIDVSPYLQQSSYYLASHGGWGLYTNTGIYVAWVLNSPATCRADWSSGGYFEYGRGGPWGTWASYTPTIGGPAARGGNAANQGGWFYYCVIGKTCFLTFNINLFTQDGSYWTFTTPPGMTPNATGGHTYACNPGFNGGLLQINPGSNVINVFRDTQGAGNWTYATWIVAGSVAFQIP